MPEQFANTQQALDQITDVRQFILKACENRGLKLFQCENGFSYGRDKSLSNGKAYERPRPLPNRFFAAIAALENHGYLTEEGFLKPLDGVA